MASARRFPPARKAAGIGQVAGDVRRQRRAAGGVEGAARFQLLSVWVLQPPLRMNPRTPTGEESWKLPEQIVPLVEGGKAALQAPVVQELHRRAARAAEARRIVDGFANVVQRVRRNAARKPLA